MIEHTDELLDLRLGKLRAHPRDPSWSMRAKLNIEAVEDRGCPECPQPWVLSAYSQQPGVELIAGGVTESTAYTSLTYGTDTYGSAQTLLSPFKYQNLTDIQMDRWEKHTAKQRHLLDERTYLERSAWYGQADSARRQARAARRDEIDAELRAEGIKPPATRLVKACYTAVAAAALALVVNIISS
jgi:hypothetical protein